MSTQHHDALRLAEIQSDYSSFTIVETQQAQAVGSSSITATNSDGVVYCISYAGKLLATIAETK